MIPLLEQHREEIQMLCRKYGITRLEVFGSAVNGKFNPETSDVDFLYERDESNEAFINGYFDLIDRFEAILGRKVDLIDAKKIENPYFLKRVNQERIPYA